LAETARTADQARAQAAAAAAQAAGTQQNAAVAGEDTFTAFAKGLSQASPTIRAKIAQQLKDAGIYRGKVSGEFNNRFYNALIEAEKRRTELATVIDVPNRFEFISGLALEGDGGAGDGGDGTYVSESISVITDEKAKALIDAVIQDQLGRKANAAEVARYTKLVKKAQKTAPTVSTSVRSGKRTTTTTTGGFDPGQYLVDQVAGTDEAKANKVLGFYEKFMRALGAD
jgi:hypothetical protein